MVDLGGSTYSGTVVSDFIVYSANSLDYMGSTIWLDVSGITRTDDIIITNNAMSGYVLTCIDSDGNSSWQSSSGITNSPFEYNTIETTAIQPVLGGNAATGTSSTIGGGTGNTASGGYSFIGGGYNNSSSGTTSFIGAGSGNTAVGDMSSIVAGSGNIVTGTRSVVSGSGNDTAGNNSVILGGFSNTITTGADIGAIIAGNNNTINSAVDYSVIIGGRGNTVSNSLAGIFAGEDNTLSGGGDNWSAIIGGYTNTINGKLSVVVGGSGNTLNADSSIIIGGDDITGTSNNTVYVPDLVIDGLTGVTDLQTDANGLVIDGASDITLKDNIETINGSLEKIVALNPVSFEWKPEINLRQGKVFGLIAQEVQEVIPEIVRERANGGGKLTLEYKEIIPWLIGAIKELSINSNIMSKEYTPTSTNDESGNVGDTVWDDDYIYIKRNNGWGRCNLEDF
jgi:hypothetical protein